MEYLGDVPQQSISGFRLIGRDNDSEGRRLLGDIYSQQEQPQHRWIKICRGILFYFKVKPLAGSFVDDDVDVDGGIDR